MLNDPAPKAATWNRPPAMTMFLRKWIIWFATDLYRDGDEITGDRQWQAGRSDIGLGHRGRRDFAKTAQNKHGCYHQAAEGSGIVVGHGTLH